MIEISDCCKKKTKMKFSESDFFGDRDDSVRTAWYECTGCGKPCNPIRKENAFVKAMASIPDKIIILDKSIVITQVDNGFEAEWAEEMVSSGEIPVYQKRKQVFEFLRDDLDLEDNLKTIEKLIRFIIDYFDPSLTPKLEVKIKRKKID